MPSGKVKERSFTLIPEGWYTGKLLEVAEREAGTSSRWKWKFEILEPEQMPDGEGGTIDTATRWMWGECWSDLDQSDGCVARRWMEALADKQYDIDDDVDTEDVVGNMAQFAVKHRSYWKKGEEETEENLHWVAEIPDDPEAIVSVSVDISDKPPF